MAEEKPKRTPTEMLMNALSNVEGAEKVVIVIQKNDCVWWDSTADQREMEYEEVQLLLMKAQNLVLLDTIGVINRKED